MTHRTFLQQLCMRGKSYHLSSVFSWFRPLSLVFCVLLHALSTTVFGFPVSPKRFMVHIITQFLPITNSTVLLVNCEVPIINREVLSGNELTCNSSGNTPSQSSQLAEPLWTDPGLKSGISARANLPLKKN